MAFVAVKETVPTVRPRSAARLYDDLLQGRQLLILDVRNEQDFARWRIDGRSSHTVVNIPYFEFIEDEEGSLARVPPAEAILVVCAKEGSAQFVADILAANGRSADYLAGGIVTWGDFYDVRPIDSGPAGQIVQVGRPARGDLSFVMISDGEAAIVDPLRHIDQYLAILDEAGARLTHIFETHGHADHISGGPALAAATGAAYYLHPYDAIHPIDMLPARLAYTPLADGQTFTVGQFAVKVIWLPGHTLGQVNYLLTPPDGPSYLFSGDGIFLRSFGRPDLGGQGEAWTPILYESLFERLPPHLQDDTLILPAHFGHLDEAGEDGRFTAPYADLLRQNDALQPRSLEEFTDFVLSHLPKFPPEYVEIKRVNAGLSHPTEKRARELELGQNICALAG